MLVPRTRNRTLPNARIACSTKLLDGFSPAFISAARPDYEDFLLILQLCSVECTLPQARAATSKTFSKRNEGGAYGFFAVVFGSCVCSPEELSLFKSPASCYLAYARLDCLNRDRPAVPFASPIIAARFAWLSPACSPSWSRNRCSKPGTPRA